MRLTVIGCAGSVPSADAACSSYLLEAEGYRLLLDMGSGSLGGLQRAGMLFDLDAIVVSHLHADHCADLAGLLVARKYLARDRDLKPISVHGPAGTADRIGAIAGSGIGNDVRSHLDCWTLLPGELEMGPFTVTVDRVNHPVETFASRVSAGGKVLTYSADTGESDALVQLAEGADLFLCEATYQDGVDNPPDVHLTARQAGQYAQRAGAEKLMLTHLVPMHYDPLDQIAAASEEYAGVIELARPDWVYEI